MDHDNTGCQSPPEGPKLCINNCGFFGSDATMNMCSKCHKSMLFQQEHSAKFASKTSPSTIKETFESIEPILVSIQPSSVEVVAEESVKAMEGPSRCTTCNKRVGLTGFKCRCGELFCGIHRYADIHDCSFNYRADAQEAIAKANPVVKGEKLDKI